MNPQAAKNHLEWLHLKYLSKQLNLNIRPRHDGWDLSSEKHEFELKTRLYYLNRSWTPESNIWFFISEKQRLAYESEADKPLYWIFMGALPAKQLKHIKTINEDYILKRNVYVTPWDIYKNFKVGKAVSNSKLGPGRVFSQKMIQSLLDFEKYDLNKGTLYLPKNEGLEYLLRP